MSMTAFWPWPAEALDYDDIIPDQCATFTQEVRDNAFIADLKAKLAAKGATLAVIWVETSPEVVHQRTIEGATRTAIPGSWLTGMSICAGATLLSRRTSPTRSTRTI